MVLFGNSMCVYNEDTIELQLKGDKRILYQFETNTQNLLQFIKGVDDLVLWSVAETEIGSNITIEYEYYPLESLSDPIRLKQAIVYNNDVKGACYVFDYFNLDAEDNITVQKRIREEYLYIRKIRGYEKYVRIGDRLIDCYQTIKENNVFKADDYKVILESIEYVEMLTHDYNQLMNQSYDRYSNNKVKVLGFYK